MWAEKERLENIIGREPTVTELAEFTETSVCEVSELLLATQPVLSLTPECDDDNPQLDVPTEAEQYKIDEHICLNDCLRDLSESDRRIIDLRYYKAQTQSVVAKQLGMSQVQVSRREKKILKEIRQKMSV